MKDQVSVFSLKHTNSVERFVFANGNYLDKAQCTRFKGTIINFIEEFKEFKEDTKKQLNKIKEEKLNENKCPNDTQGNTSTG